ncbi:MAG: hypothetical protein K2G37_04425, partial [Clostridia bacterium]|nr:hypothetical protein [Clostridia bacterium]
QYVEAVLGCIEEDIETWQGVLSKETLPSDDSFCECVVELAQILSRLDSNKLANATYEYVNNKASFADIKVLSKYAALSKHKDNLLKLIESLGDYEGEIFDKLLIKCKTLTLSNFQVISSQFVTLCDYISQSGGAQLSSTVDVLIRAFKYQDELLERVSLREILSSTKYISLGLNDCDGLDVTFDVFNKLFDKEIFNILSQSPQLINVGLNFVCAMDIDTVADIISYTFYPNISVALLHALNEQEIINKDNISMLAQEISQILIDSNIQDLDFEEFFFRVNQVDDRGEYLFNPKNLFEEQEEYICNNIQPFFEFINNFFQRCDL